MEQYLKKYNMIQSPNINLKYSKFFVLINLFEKFFNKIKLSSKILNEDFNPAN